MSQKLPTPGFEWLNNLTNENVIKKLEKKDTNISYIFEVDLEYRKELWESPNDYPLAPKKIKVDNVKKLVGSFYTKHNYALHAKILNNILNRV